MERTTKKLMHASNNRCMQRAPSTGGVGLVYLLSTLGLGISLSRDQSRCSLPTGLSTNTQLKKQSIAVSGLRDTNCPTGVDKPSTPLGVHPTRLWSATVRRLTYRAFFTNLQVSHSKSRTNVNLARHNCLPQQLLGYLRRPQEHW